MIFGLSRIYVIGLRGICIISENVGVTYSRVRSTSSLRRPTFDFRTRTRLSAPLYRVPSLLNNRFNTFPLSLLNASNVVYREIVPFFFL